MGYGGGRLGGGGYGGRGVRGVYRDNYFLFGPEKLSSAFIHI